MHVRTLIEGTPDWLQLLETVYKIHVVRDEYLVSLKYNLIESPMAEPIVQECRGMVVDTSGIPRILAHPYNKFWNLGEPLADTIDWSTARVQEKLDGSLITMFFHYGLDKWCVASSGHPTAGGSFGASEETFRDGFWRIFAELGMKLPPVTVEIGFGYSLGTEVCYMFELCATENRVVVRHDKPRIVVHGARFLGAGSEMPRELLRLTAAACNWELVKEHPLTSIDDVMAAVEALDPIQNEGFVVVDAAFNRVKIKSPRYVILHHLKGEATPRRAIELWQTGEAGELLMHFPEMAPQILPIQERLDNAAHAALACFYKHCTLPTRKDFALAVKEEPWAAAVFLLYKEAAPTLDHAKTIMRGQSLAALERLLERV
jgi:hypothetical protein